MDSEDSLRIHCLKQLLVSMTLDVREEWADALAALRLALDVGLELEDRDVLANLGNAALHLGDDEAHRRYFTVMLSAAREDGAAMEVLYALHRLPFSQLAAGDWSAVRGSADQALALSVSTGLRAQTAAPLAWLTLLAALEGRPEYDALLAEVEGVVDGQSLGVLADPVVDLLRWARGVRAGHDGDAAEALHQLGRLRLRGLTRRAALDRIDAAVRANERGQAQLWIDELASFADATAWPWALAAADHGRALLADAPDAPAFFDSALAHHARSGRPYERARTQLAYGEFLRRSQRRVEARTHLRPALETFEELRAEPLVVRARQELRASGETARRRDPSTAVELTPMELQVAHLVSQGLSNKDVAAQCWVSPRTVAFHLRNIFTKTGVTSRGELAQLDLRRPA